MRDRKLPIKQWAKDDRPREKLLSKSPQALSDSELLAILMGSGPRGSSAVELAREVLRKSKGDLQELGRRSVKELMQIRGIGSARAVTIAAAMELARRRAVMIQPEKIKISGSRDCADFLRSALADHRHEVFAVMLLNTAGRLNHFEVISQGGLTGTIADPRLILRKALEHDATGIILSHNHPSGQLRASRSDIDLTARIRDACKLLDIRLLDHIIVSDEGYLSLADQNLM